MPVWWDNKAENEPTTNAVCVESQSEADSEYENR